MGILIVMMVCVYAIGSMVFWRNIPFSKPRKAVFCLTILPLFFAAVVFNVWMIDTFAPGLLALLADAQADDARVRQAGIYHRNTAPLIALLISTPIALIISYCWFALLRALDQKQTGMPLPEKAHSATSLRHLFLAALPLLGFSMSQAAESPRVAGHTAPTHKSNSANTARMILAVPKNRSSWDDVMAREEYYDLFIWNAHGDETERWNELAGSGAGLAKVKREVVNGKDVFLSYKGRTLKEPLVNNREDNIIAIHTLNLLVKADSEIRYCVDSTGSSDIAFLALPPTDWRTLEKEFGVKAVAYRFMPLPDDLPAFQKALESEDNIILQRKYINQ